MLQDTERHCKTLQYDARHCNTMQDTAIHSLMLVSYAHMLSTYKLRI